MPERRDPPPTDEGWYALHDFRTVDWDAWRDASERTRRRALAEVIDHLDSRLAVADADEGASALYSVLGHKADFMIVHLRPTTAHLGALERQFELTDFAGFTDQTTSFVSVTEASGYSETARDYFDDDAEVNPGLKNYIEMRLEPSIPDATHVCFYPMDKRREPDQNWYDLSFEERAEHMAAHGDIGRDYGGKVTQMITGAIGIDDWEWGVTLWAEDLVDVKDLLYEMRFDPSTSRFAEFGQFYVGRHMAPSDLPALLAGQAVPPDEEVTPDVPTDVGAGELDVATVEAAGASGRTASAGADRADPSDSDGGQVDGSETADSEGEKSVVDEQPGEPGEESAAEPVDPEDMQGHLLRLGLHESEDYSADQHAVVVYSSADAKDLAEEVDGLRGHFGEYDTHVETTVRAQSGKSAVASIWETERATEIASGFLSDLPAVTRSLRGPLAEAADTTEEDHTATESADIRKELADLDVYAGQPHGEDVYALVLYSEAPVDDLEDAVSDLRDGFDRYDTHEGTHVYVDPEGGNAAVASLWETRSAASTASDYLVDLPGVVGWADAGDGFGTMGLFYSVEPDHREDFVSKFAEVGDLLESVDGHRHSALLVRTDDENDMFIASQWDSKDDAMAFFRSDTFAETVDWGRDILTDKPRHVFLA